jgi:AraC-like DNA-binding protein
MYRRWRVRHRYPLPVVELARLLLAFQGVREISALLDIPASVIYRWRAGQPIDGTVAQARLADPETIAALIERCDEIGFHFTDRLRSADGLAWETTMGARAGAHATARGGDDAAEAVGRRHVAARAVVQHPARECGAQHGYAFDARKERSSRRVRPRLEAARHMIDAEYFLDLDCRTLAEAAQMSRHHFIRMFNQMFGLTPHQYLIRARIEAAKRLLLASREPIEVIAAGVGFRSGASLNRAFKQVEGASVSRFCQTARRDHLRNAPRNVGPGPSAPSQPAL